MPKVAPVRLTYNPKILWFDPVDIDIHAGDKLIVSTERGTEFGTADSDLKEVPEEAIEALDSPLKPVLRIATEEDEAHWEEQMRLAEAAVPVFKRMVEEQGLDMRPVTVEYLFDGDKGIFYFESEERVDFRNLVRSLASEFHIRVDMRQIGVRDEARIVGGYGHCGQELCCARMGGKFNPVTIRMAKDQDLSLNPQKISGVCGRLMCCLRYESDVYKEFKTGCPKLNAKVDTPEGEAKVVEVNVPRETVTILTSDNKRIRVPVADMTVERENNPNGKPDTVPEDVYFECKDANNAAKTTALLVDKLFTGNDKVAENPRAVHNPSRRRADGAAKEGEGASKRSRRRRSRSKNGSDAQAGQPKQQQAKQPKKAKGQQDKNAQQKTAKEQQQAKSQRTNQKPRRRHVTTGGAAGAGASAEKQPQQAQQQKQQKPQKQQSNRKPRPQKQNTGARPGQRSSGLAETRSGQGTSNHQSNNGAAGEHRRTRRRSHKAQGSEGQQQQEN